MNSLLDIFLVIHITFGSIAVLAGPVAMATRKGGRYHRLGGKTYYGSMIGVLITSLVICYLTRNIFLTLVSVFTFHMITSGYRALYLKKLHVGQRAAPVDWVIGIVAGLFNLGLLAFAVLIIATKEQAAFGYISLVFSFIGLSFVWRDIKKFIKPPKEKQHWLYDHISGMMGGYIATITAVSAVNFTFMPTIFVWLWPSAIGTPAIIMWVGFYRKKFNKGKEAKDLTTLKINTQAE